MRKRILYPAFALLAGAAAAALMIHARAAATGAVAPVAPELSANLVCAAGKVEPVSEELKIGSQVSGVLHDVPVNEGQRVPKGGIIAVLENGDFAARVAEAEATLAIRQAELERLINGPRDQERREASASADEAKAVLANARAEMERRRTLFQSGDISRSDWERAEREYQVAEARVSQAAQHSSFIDAPARNDEKLRDEASVALAKAQLAEARAVFEKTIVRAPFTGTVLKRYRKAGETVSDKGDTPIVSFGDNSRLRVRVDVDETDVARLHVGDSAYFTAQAFGGQRFTGRVVQIGSELGLKNIDTGDPIEKVDTKILETLVELDGHPPLPAGLRVDSYISTGGGK